MTQAPPDRRCPTCGARVGEADRSCLACQRPLPRRQAAPRDPVPLARPEPAPAQPVVTPEPARPSTPTPEPLTLEIVHGRSRQRVVIPSGGAVIGSTPDAGVPVPAPFLSPAHARLEPRADGWHVVAISENAVVIQGGATRSEARVEPGEVLRLADRIGNFVTLRAVGQPRRSMRESALRAALPSPGESFMIGSDPSCAVRIEHPLVQPRHAALRRADDGSLWLADRATAAGTYVNDRRLRGRVRLAVGDLIQIGPASATVSETGLEPLPQFPGVDIAVADASVAVADKSGTRELLHDVFLRLEPATVTAVVGPSGAGKTTLMRLLSGQLAATRGLVTYNGSDVRVCREAFAPLMGFVPQDDVVHLDLTVAEALAYQARLRLGRSADDAVRGQRVAQLLTMLGLDQQRDQIVGTLSGGQRKRVSIACELLNEPRLLFLDEPTSGLDPGLDKRMMLLLRLLADQGRTVVLTTHSLAHVSVCDSVILVGPGGHVMFAGPPDEAPAWFGVQALSDVFAVTDAPDVAAEAGARVALAARAGRRDGSGEPAQPTASPPAAGSRPAAWSPAWRSMALSQGRVFLSRQTRLLTRDRGSLAFTLLQGVVVAVLTALVAPHPLDWAVNGSSTTFVLGCAAVWFGMIGAVRAVVSERAIWRREFMAGASLPGYLGAKVLVLASLGLVSAVTMTVVVALTVHLPESSPVADPSVDFVITLWLASLSGTAVGLLVSATSATASRAMSLVPYLLIAQLVLCGVLFKLGALTFVSWLTPARWAVSTLGGIAGLSSATLGQSSGLYPHSAGGVLLGWLVLLLLAGLGVAATTWSLARQGRAWQTGAEAAVPLWASLRQQGAGRG